MKSILYLLVALCLVVSCRKKDTYGYTCRCNDNATKKEDTFYTIRVRTSGEADWECNRHEDTANKYGKNIDCEID